MDDRQQGRVPHPLARYICDGCNRKMQMGYVHCPRCGTLVDGRRRLA